jgi:hypothetical protein
MTSSTLSLRAFCVLTIARTVAAAICGERAMGASVAAIAGQV